MNISKHRTWRMLFTLIVVPAGIFIALSLFLYVFQSNMIYFPSYEISATPGTIGLSYETVSFKTEDGIKLSGWLVPAEISKGTVLFCHGNAGNISHRLDSIRLFNQLGLDVFIFDYRGYGHSEGKPEEKGTYRDVEAAWQFLVQERNVSPDKIIVFGRSLGGAIAAWIAQVHTPKMLILESSFTSVPDIASDIYPFLPVRLLARFKYHTAAYIQKVNCPVLVIHSIQDELIAFKHGQKLYETANEPKEFLKITGGHNDGFFVSGKHYIDGLNNFISVHIEN